MYQHILNRPSDVPAEKLQKIKEGIDILDKRGNPFLRVFKSPRLMVFKLGDFLVLVTCLHWLYPHYFGVTLSGGLYGTFATAVVINFSNYIGSNIIALNLRTMMSRMVARQKFGWSTFRLIVCAFAFPVAYLLTPMFFPGYLQVHSMFGLMLLLTSMVLVEIGYCKLFALIWPERKD